MERHIEPGRVPFPYYTGSQNLVEVIRTVCTAQRLPHTIGLPFLEKKGFHFDQPIRVLNDVRLVGIIDNHGQITEGGGLLRSRRWRSPHFFEVGNSLLTQLYGQEFMPTVTSVDMPNRRQTIKDYLTKMGQLTPTIADKATRVCVSLWKNLAGIEISVPIPTRTLTIARQPRIRESGQPVVVLQLVFPPDSEIGREILEIARQAQVMGGMRIIK